MHHLHALAHQDYEERVRMAERQARFLAECGVRATGEPAVVGWAVPHPLRGLRNLLRQRNIAAVTGRT